MKESDQILERMRLLRNKLLELEELYKGRVKGRAYRKNKDYLEDQLKAQYDRLNKLGTKGTLYKVSLTKYDNKTINNPIRYTFFQNIDTHSINRICEFRFPGWSVLEKQKIALGELMDK